MTLIRDIADKMELIAPCALAEKWDNVGLLVGSPNAEVKRVLISLDMDSAAVAEGIEKNADLIITHHPIMLQPVNRITDEDLTGRLIQSLIRNNIAMFAAHTNLDSADGGVNDVLASKLGLADIQSLSMPRFDGCARMGTVKPLTFGEFAHNVKEKLNSAVIKCVGDKGRIIKKVAVCGGAGAFMLTDAKENGCDVLVTGEAKYNDEQLAHELGICLVEAGHFETENVICEALREKLQASFKNTEFIVSQRKRTYYTDI